MDGMKGGFLCLFNGVSRLFSWGGGGSKVCVSLGGSCALYWVGFEVVLCGVSVCLCGFWRGGGEGLRPSSISHTRSCFPSPLVDPWSPVSSLSS